MIGIDLCIIRADALKLKYNYYLILCLRCLTEILAVLPFSEPSTYNIAILIISHVLMANFIILLSNIMT